MIKNHWYVTILILHGGNVTHWIGLAGQNLSFQYQENHFTLPDGIYIISAGLVGDDKYLDSSSNSSKIISIYMCVILVSKHYYVGAGLWIVNCLLLCVLYACILDFILIGEQSSGALLVEGLCELSPSHYLMLRCMCSIINCCIECFLFDCIHFSGS